mmetsp:Transcript_7693/g.17551  ORF Transcript_7693/g.17551 Transcript_7693/m.17551 type:complete len:83 (+) Transcript_7693:131-379(+)
MVKIVNGEVVTEGAVLRRSKSPLDRIAELFWGIVSFFVLFFNSMFSPKGGSFKPAKPGKPQIRGVNRGGSTNGSPPFCGGGG